MASFCGIGLGVKKGHKIHSFPNARPLKKLAKLNGKNFKSKMKPLGTDLEEKRVQNTCVSDHACTGWRRCYWHSHHFLTQHRSLFSGRSLSCHDSSPLSHHPSKKDNLIGQPWKTLSLKGGPSYFAHKLELNRRQQHSTAPSSSNVNKYTVKIISTKLFVNLHNRFWGYFQYCLFHLIYWTRSFFAFYFWH